MDIRPVASSDRDWVRRVLTDHFASPRIVSRGVVHQADDLPGLLAEDSEGAIGLALYRVSDAACEIVALLSHHERRGVGTALLERAVHIARGAGCRRVWLVTTNDNTGAVRFYHRRGFRQIAVHHGAVIEARRLKPEIPESGPDGTPKVDEIEFELMLTDP